jgi:HPt (histidine-containing phosphotransfer) domain-containing protein
MRNMIGNFENDANRDIRGLEVAVANHDWVAFKDSAHALKGAAMYLGLAQLAKLSTEAQNLSEDEFQRSGILQIKELRKATDAALQALRDKLKITSKTG